MTFDVPEILKPKWRGVLHQYAFYVAVVGVTIAVAAWSTSQAPVRR